MNKVYSFLLLGIGRTEICQYASTNWGVSDRQTDRYIEKANEEFRQRVSRDRNLQFGKAAARLDYLNARALNEGDCRQALAVQKQIIALYNLEDREIDRLTEQVSALERIKDVNDDTSKTPETD